MTRLLVCARPKRRGEVVVVMPEGWRWGGRERQPHFIQVDITDNPSKRRMRPFVTEVLRRNSQTGKLDLITRRRLRVRPAVVRQLIRQKRWRVEVTEAQFRSYVEVLKNNGRRDHDVTDEELDGDQGYIKRLDASEEI